VWGAESPFLRPVDDSVWEMASSNPAKNRSWASAYSWTALATALGFQRLSSITVPSRGSEGRTGGVSATGFQGGALVTRALDGWDVRQSLGLLSPGFEISVRTVGGPGAVPLVGDWNGDSRDDVGWWADGDVALSVGGLWTKRMRAGKAGDVPVVGDWNRDGKDDVGIFRAGRWFVRTDAGDGRLNTTFVFGTRGDKPVAGRWNGRTLGVGVVRGGRWLLRNTATAGRTQRSFTYGAATDRPLAGDWNGNRHDTAALVAATTFSLRNRAGGGPVARTLEFTG